MVDSATFTMWARLTLVLLGSAWDWEHRMYYVLFVFDALSSFSKGLSFASLRISLW